MSTFQVFVICLIFFVKFRVYWSFSSKYSHFHVRFSINQLVLMFSKSICLALERDYSDVELEQMLLRIRSATILLQSFIFQLVYSGAINRQLHNYPLRISPVFHPRIIKIDFLVKMHKLTPNVYVEMEF